MSYNSKSGAPAVVAKSPKAKPTVDITVQKTATVISENANLRSSPGNSGIVSTMVPGGEVVTVVKQSGAWFYVDYNGAKGWIHGNPLGSIILRNNPQLASVAHREAQQIKRL